MNLIVENLKGLSKNSADSAVRRTARMLLSLNEKNSIPYNGFADLIVENLKKYNDSKAVRFLQMKKLYEKAEDLGIKKAINNLRNTDLFKENGDFSFSMISIEEQIEAGVSEGMLVETFLGALNPYRWDKTVSESIISVEFNAGESKTYVALNKAINTYVEKNKNGQYDRIIALLMNAYYLPEDNIRQYIWSTFQNEMEGEKTLQELMNTLYMVDNRTETSKIRYHMSALGRHPVVDRLSPVVAEGKSVFFMLNDRIYERIGKKVKMVNNPEQVTEKFLALCNTFTNFEVVSEGLKLKDTNVYDITVIKENKDVKVKLDDRIITKSELVEELNDIIYLGERKDHIQNVVDLIESIDEIGILEDVVCINVLENGLVIDIMSMKPEEASYINIYDPATGGSELYDNTGDLDAVASIANEHGIDIMQYVKEQVEPGAESEVPDLSLDPDELKKADEKAKKMAKLEELEDALGELNDNLAKYEELDDAYKSDDEVTDIVDKMRNEKEQIEGEIDALNNEIESKYGEEDITHEYSDKFVVDLETLILGSADINPEEVGISKIVDGESTKVDDNFTITPAIEVIIGEEGNVMLGGVFVRVDTGEDTDISGKIDGVVDGNYVPIVDEPTAFDPEVVNGLEAKVESVVNSLTATYEGAEGEEDDDDAEKPEGAEGEEDDDEEKADEAVAKKDNDTFKSKVQKGLKKAGDIGTKLGVFDDKDDPANSDDPNDPEGGEGEDDDEEIENAIEEFFKILSRRIPTEAKLTAISKVKLNNNKIKETLENKHANPRAKLMRIKRLVERLKKKLQERRKIANSNNSADLATFELKKSIKEDHFDFDKGELRLNQGQRGWYRLGDANYGLMVHQDILKQMLKHLKAGDSLIDLGNYIIDDMGGGKVSVFNDAEGDEISAYKDDLISVLSKTFNESRRPVSEAIQLSKSGDMYKFSDGEYEVSISQSELPKVNTAIEAGEEWSNGNVSVSCYGSEVSIYDEISGTEVNGLAGDFIDLISAYV